MIKRYNSFINEGFDSTNVDKIVDILSKCHYSQAFTTEIVDISKGYHIGIEFNIYKLREYSSHSKKFEKELEYTKRELLEKGDDRVELFLNELIDIYNVYNPDMTLYNNFIKYVANEAMIFDDILEKKAAINSGFWSNTFPVKYKYNRVCKYVVILEYNNCFNETAYYDNFNTEILKELANFIEKIESDGHMAKFKFSNNGTGAIQIYVFKND